MSRVILVAAILSIMFLSSLWSLTSLARHAIISEDHDQEMHLRPSVKREPRKALIIASYGGQDVSWTDHIPMEWEIHRSLLDQVDPKSPYSFPVPRNQGREGMAYMTYIIDNYDNLPDYMIFVHGHYRSWHQQETITSKVRALNITALDQHRYISLRCNNNPGPCFEPLGAPTWPLPEANFLHDTFEDLPGFWRTLFPPTMDKSATNFSQEDPRRTGILPRTAKGKCCAQFAVTRDKVKDLSLDMWKHLRMPMERDLMEFTWGKNLNSHTVGFLYEVVWHLIFGMPVEHCPDDNYCREVLFSNAITCDVWVSLGGEAEDAHCESLFDDDEDKLLRPSSIDNINSS